MAEFFLFLQKNHEKRNDMKIQNIFQAFLMLALFTALVQCNTQNQTKSKAEKEFAQKTGKTVKADNETAIRPEPSEIETNYHDLPDSVRDQLVEAIAVNQNNKLTERSINIIKDYWDIYLLKNNNLPGRGITSNYFWYIYNALPDFVNKDERHQGYYVGENKQNFEKQLQAYGIYRIDRSSENLKRIFKFVKPVLKEFVSPEKYRSLGADTKTDQLIKIYETIQEKENYKQLLTQAYNHADTATGEWLDYGGDPVFETYSAAYGLDAYKLSEIICNYLEYDRYHPYYGHRDLSFWMRRVHEGNEETVYELLKNIQSIYE